MEAINPLPKLSVEVKQSRKNLSKKKLCLEHPTELLLKVMKNRKQVK
jgi:hypothetical protein